MDDSEPASIAAVGRRQSGDGPMDDSDSGLIAAMGRRGPAAAIQLRAGPDDLGRSRVQAMYFMH